MDWHIHALYALAIVVAALIGWRFWKNEAEAVISIGKSRDRIADEYDELKERLRQCIDQRNDAEKVVLKNGASIRHLAAECDKAESRAQSAEQSRRAYKGHNKRYRERIAELETELDACYQDCAQLEAELEPDQ